MTGADILVDSLRDRGIDFLSAVSGNGLAPILDACRRARFRVIDTRTEYSAAYLAEAYARLTGKVGVVAASSGIAHVNANAGLMNGWFDGSPLLLITGESARYGADTGVFQEFDHANFASAFCKYSVRVEAASQIEFCLNEAIAQAVSGRPGPVQLSIPISVSGSKVNNVDSTIRRSPAQVAPFGAGDPTAIERATTLLQKAKRPILIAGSGAFYARAGNEVVKMAKLLPAPLTTPIWDRGVVSQAGNNFVGVIGAASGGPKLLNNADVILIAGVQVDYRLGHLQSPAIDAKARIIRIDAEPNQLHKGVSPDVAISGNIGTVLADLALRLDNKNSESRREWLEDALRINGKFRDRFNDDPPAEDGPMTGHHLIEALRPYAEDGETMILIDGGNIGQWAHQVLSDRYPAHWLTCGASGVVGWGIAGAMGARLARPNARIILLIGDGAAHFGLPELEAAVRQNLPFVGIVADDRAWGIVVTEQRAAYGEEGITASLLGKVAYAGLASSYGARGAVATTLDGLRIELSRSMNIQSPTIIHAPIKTGGPTEGMFLDTKTQD